MLTAPRKLNTVAEAEQEETLAEACVIETAKKAAETRMRLKWLDSQAATTMALANAAAHYAAACREEAEQLQHEITVAVEKYKECFLKRVEMVAMEQVTIEAAAVNQTAAENYRMNVSPWEVAEITAANIKLLSRMSMTHSGVSSLVMNVGPAPFKAPPTLPPTHREIAQNSSSSFPTSSPGSSARIQEQIPVKSAPRMKAPFPQLVTARIKETIPVKSAPIPFTQLLTDERSGCYVNFVRSKAPPPLFCPSQNVAAEVSPEFPSVDAYDEC